MKLFSLLLRHSSRGAVVLAFFAAILSGIASVGFPALITSALSDAEPENLARLGGVFLGVCILVPATRLMSQFLLVRLAQNAALNLRMRFSRQIAAAPLLLQEKIGRHRILAAVSEDLPTLVVALTMIPAICVNVALVLGCLVYMGWLSWPLLIVVAALIVFGSIATQLPSKLGSRRMKRVREESDTFFKLFRSINEGAKEIKLHARRRAALLELLQGSAETLKEIGVSARMIFNVSAALGQLLFFFIMGLVLFAITRWLGFDREVLIGFTIALFFIKQPLQGILENLPDLSQANVSLDKLDSLGLSLSNPSEHFEADALSEPASWAAIELQGVTHSYKRDNSDDTFTLGPIDLTFSPGELVFIVGGNGSGKTTLAKLLVGIYAPAGGEVRLDGLAITPETRDLYRQLFSVVFSDFFLFDNLLGLEKQDLDGRAERYLDMLHLSHKVQVKDGKLSTTDLSQGQRKRLALLTAYLENRAIYLFDEWAADQDPLFKEIFYRKLLPELKAAGKSVLVISHDDRYYNAADRIIKLENGRIESDLRPPIAATKVESTAEVVGV